MNGTGSPGIFNTSYTADSEYGIYNYCNMPHVRKTEYQVPSSDYELQYVEVIQRHHKRTPYATNTLFKEDITWDCTGEGPFAGAKATSFNTTQVYWQAETGTRNPFEDSAGPGFTDSTCQFPAITSAGLEDAHQHGEDIAGVYGDLLHFLPRADETEKYQWRVTNNVITSQTLSGFARGIFPDITESPALIQSRLHDSLEPAISCPSATAIRAANEGDNPNWTIHLSVSSDIRDRFNNVSGIQSDDTAGWSSSWDHPFDNLSSKQCHQKSLPCSVNNNNLCLSQGDADTIYRLGHWEYAYRWRGAEKSTLYSALIMGAWFRELRGHFTDHVAGARSIRYQHNFAHDGSISAVLGVLQIDYPVWPGTGSEVIFELWKKSESYYVRVLWSGQPLKTSTPLGTLDMVGLDDFDGYLDDTIPHDLVAACDGEM